MVRGRRNSSGTTPCGSAASRPKCSCGLDLEGDRVVSEHRYLEGKIGRIRDVRLGPDGFLYLATDLEDGGIYRLEPRNEASAGK